MVMVVAAQARELEWFGGERLNWKLDYAARKDDWLLIAGGAGPVLARDATEAGMERERCEAVVSAGYCGGLDPRLAAGSVVVGTAINGVAVDAPVASIPHVRGGIVSVDRVVTRSAEKRVLADSGNIAVEMEAAAVFDCARRAGVPFFCVKVITDTAAEDLAIDFNRARDAEGRICDGRVVREALARPSSIPGLIRLARRARLASRVLGEFLVSCDFRQ